MPYSLKAEPLPTWRSRIIIQLVVPNILKLSHQNFFNILQIPCLSHFQGYTTSEFLGGIMQETIKYLSGKSKKIFNIILYLPNILYFLFVYREYLKNPSVSNFPKIRSVAFRSNGKSLDLAHAFGKKKYKQSNVKFPSTQGMLNLSDQDLIESKKSMREFGFWIAPKTIDPRKLDLFYAAAIKNLYQVKNVQASPSEVENIASLWDQDMVNLDTQWVADQDLTLELATSPDVVRIATEYIGASPVLNYPESWFSFPVSKIQKGSAKNWHWDCDGIKWLKVFVYLNDVNLNNGPHAFVAGSHRNWKVNDKGTRVTEEQIVNSYGEKMLQIFTAPRGTVIFEDTRGFHRGTPLVFGHRLVLQLQFNLDSFALGKSKIKLPQKYVESSNQFPRMLNFLEN